MTYYILQTTLLLVAAYLLGAWIGCTCRSWNSYRQYMRANAATGAGSHRSEAALVAAAGSSTEMAATGDRDQNSSFSAGNSPDYTIWASAAATALAANMAAAAASDQATEDDNKEVDESVTLPESEPPEPETLESPPVSEAEKEPAPEPLLPATDQNDKKTDPAAVTEQTVVEPDPVAAASSAALAASAAAVASANPDDLKRIRGIGTSIEEKLHALDIKSYSQIANWSSEDVKRFGSELNFEGRIERENWIEQAQVLSTGGTTVFAGRVDRGEVPSSIDETEVSNEEDSNNTPAPVKDSDDPEDDGGAQSSGNSSPAGENGTSGTSSASSAQAGNSRAISWQEQSGPATGSEEPVLKSTANKGRKIQTENSSLISAQEEKNSNQIAVNRPKERILEKSGSSDIHDKVRTLQFSKRDDLKRIKGIGVIAEKRLNAMGITSYDQLASWSTEEIKKVEEDLELNGRIRQENWVAQAKILAFGRQSNA